MSRAAPAPIFRPRRRGLNGRQREALWGYLFIAPWLIGFLAFVLGPMLFSLYTSFTNYDITSRFDWVGVRNYVGLFTQDSRFWKALGNTAYYATFAVPLGIATGLLIATLLNQQVPGQRLFRTIFFLPKVLTGVAVLLLWLWVFNPQVGLINTALYRLGVNENNLPLWFGDPVWSKPALIIMSMWTAAGSFMFYLAALKGVPRDLYESAQIDGASPVRQFWAVTVPLISPVIFFKLITGISAAMQFWSESLVLTKGGPSDSTLFYGLYIWQTAFTDLRMGYASAMAWILLLITLAITGVQLWLSKRWVHYEGEVR
ncbi:spermidine/putrescine ABC transporter permease [Deinococcus aetherius]|uniref:Spermidine/putrescine ABC transporter permease n=1 Tax=Deinococcus aetherius TaxID=200252 RepID=A0ABM8ACP2_9DEIO|nr:sugar ABC transporter permease [Deinococcus aetherius]BDP41481.1 spermidine/putrescine ABC transporter permease [Deinococcus aetherius]